MYILIEEIGCVYNSNGVLQQGESSVMHQSTLLEVLSEAESFMLLN